MLVEEIDGQGNGAGYTGGYMRVCVRGGKPGEIARVRITGTDGEELTGEIIENEKGEIHMSDCLFCKIAAGEIPSTKVYEDETTLAFLRHRAAGIGARAGDPQETRQRLVRRAGRKRRDARAPDARGGAGRQERGHCGKRLPRGLNCGDDAQQTVKHLHLHVLGGKRWTAGWPDAQTTASKTNFCRKAKNTVDEMELLRYN